MEDFCANYYICAIHLLQDPNSIPGNGFFSVAQWYGSFVTYLFFQDIWVSFGWTAIAMAMRYALLTVLLWARYELVYDLIFEKNAFFRIDYSDMWVGVVLILCGIFIAYLLCYIINVPLIVRDPWVLYDRIVAQRVHVSISPVHTRREYLWHKIKYYVYIAIIQWGGTGLLFFLGLISQRSLDYANILYFVLQLLLIFLFATFGYKNNVERHAVWRGGMFKYATFIAVWTCVFFIIYMSAFVFRDYVTVIVLMTTTLVLSVLMIPMAIIRFFIQ